MVLVSYSGREINAKLVYYGPGLSGKTTNLEWIYGAIPRLTPREDGLDEDEDGADALLRLPPDPARRALGLQDPLPPLHRARAGLLQRHPQARL